MWDGVRPAFLRCLRRAVWCRRLYRSIHRTFEEYCRVRPIAFRASYGRRWRSVLQTVQADVWQQAVEQAGNKIPSGRIVKDVVDRIRERTKVPNPYCYAGYLGTDHALRKKAIALMRLWSWYSKHFSSLVAPWSQSSLKVQNFKSNRVSVSDWRTFHPNIPTILTIHQADPRWLIGGMWSSLGFWI